MKRAKQALALLLSLALLLGLCGLAEEPVEAAVVEELIEEAVEVVPEEAEASVEEELPAEEAPVGEAPVEEPEEEPVEKVPAEEESVEMESFAVEDLGAYKWEGTDEERRTVTRLSIPEGYTSIDKDACLNMRSLTHVSIPSTVTLIDSCAFGGCWALPSISIPGSVVEIRNATFADDEALTSVELHEGLEKIGNITFQKCTSLSNFRIPSTVKEIGNSTFEETAVRSITLPKSLVTIGSAFSDCASLTSVTFEDGFSGTLTSTFSGCTSLVDINFGDGFTGILNSPFRGCTALKEISIPKGASDNSTYEGCTSLETVTYPENAANFVSIFESKFKDCPSLRTVYLPKNCKIDESVNPFADSPNVTVYLFKGTQAETACKKYNIPYKYRTGNEDATVSLPVGSISLSQKETTTIKPTTEGLSKKESYSFSSSDKSVAQVSTKGKITAKGVGTATITVTGKTSGASASCTVTVISAPTTVRIEKPTKADYTTDDEAFSLAASVEPADALQSIKWTSSDESVASVSAEGLVTLVGQGKATITAKTEKKGTNGKQRTDTFVLNVEDPHMPANVRIVEKASGQVYLDKDKTLTLTCAMDPVKEGQEAISAVKWTIPKAKERKVATIDEATGEMKPLKEGSVTVKVTTVKKGGTGSKLKQLSDTVKVTVVDPLKPRAVTINGGAKEIPLYLGSGSLTLTSAIEPATATPGVTWSIPSKSHRKIATIDANTGVLTPTGTKTGTVTVKVTTTAKKANKKAATATIKVVVADPKLPYSVSIEQGEEAEVKQDGTLKLTASIEPASATEKTALTWSITKSQKKYAMVDADGTVHGLKSGKTVTVTVKTANGKKDTIKVKVVP